MLYTRLLAAAALVCSTVFALPPATRIDDPKAFVTDVYRRLTTRSKGHSYEPPNDIYTARLGKLFREDQQRAKGEVGCLDFDFWINGEDAKITGLAITSTSQGPDQMTVIAKFLNSGDANEIHFDFRREGGRWLLDEVQSVRMPKWSVSQILKCVP